MRATEWRETANATNDTATATKSAKTTGRHTLSAVIASFSSSSSSALLTITVTLGGTSSTITHYVHGADVIPLEIQGDVNTSVAAALAAGGSGVVGRVNIIGHTDG